MLIFLTLNKGMPDGLQIHSLIDFSVLMLGKELYLKAYGHSKVLLLNLIH